LLPTNQGCLEYHLLAAFSVHRSEGVMERSTAGREPLRSSQ
jgi:hypothetical protein